MRERNVTSAVGKLIISSLDITFDITLEWNRKFRVFQTVRPLIIADMHFVLPFLRQLLAGNVSSSS